MGRRYLFGPIAGSFAQQNLSEQRERGDCMTFGPGDDVDLTIGPNESWESVLARLPADRQPDFIAVYLQYRTIPPWIWSARVPIVALAGDWNLLWHSYRRQLQLFDLVFADATGAEVMTRAGISHVRPAILFGGERDFLEAKWPDVQRDIDVLFVGNFHPAVQRDRLAWLPRLARLGERWNVVLATNVHGDQYRKLLARARIVFNRGIRSEWNLRVNETLAAGAMLFQETSNREVPLHLRDREECVYYSDENLESLLEHYLQHEEERCAIAAAGRARVREFSFGRFWHEQLNVIDQEWDSLVARAAQREAPAEAEQLRTRVWQTYSATTQTDPTLIADLEAFVEAHPDSAAHWNALGYARAMIDRAGPAHAGAQALPAFQKARAHDTSHVVAGLNVAEAFLQVGDAKNALEQARAALAAIDNMPALDYDRLDAGHYPVEFDSFRVEWEKAAWQNAGVPEQEASAKRDLLRWRLHLLIADLTGDIEHYQKAADARPDLPHTQAALGCALGRAARFADAVAPLQKAVAANPFDADAARALFQVLKETGATEAHQQFSRERRLLHKAAPQAIALEPWFQTPAEKFKHLSLNAFQDRYGRHDFTRALHAFTPPRDAQIVLTLLVHARPKRVLEIGTAAGHMTANLTEWTDAEAQIFSIGVTNDMRLLSQTPQRCEDPPRSEFGKHSNDFGKANKVLFITADSLAYDFSRLAPLDFVFIDGAHDLEHVLADTQNALRALRPGGWILWHDFNSPTPWVKVREALEQQPFASEIHFVEGTEVAYFQKPADLLDAPVARLPAQRENFSILWEGDHNVLHSLSLVNRAFCEGLIQGGHRVQAAPDGQPVDFCIRQQWPPSFSPPASGHWVIMQPWEFGSLPKDWATPMSEFVDELWVNTRYVRDVYLASGIPADRVHLVPLGIDVERFHPAAAPLTLRTTKRFKFLFVGGTIFRKGIDILLDAYAATFRRRDDVCLVIKDMGVGTFYQGQTAEQRIAELQTGPDAPEIEYIDRALTAEELAGLYTACDCLAHPYRGEGFGLPIAEAMASGLAVIVTGMGAALDFCNETNAYLVPAERVSFSKNQVGDLETVQTPWLAQPSHNALCGLLRYVAAHPDEVRAKGAIASEHIRQHFTWQQAVTAAENRLHELRQKPIRRLTAVEQTRVAIRLGSHVSLCMIVKNEERMLGDCLRSVADLFGEIIIVDTGSTDRTKEIARSFGAKVIDFQWINSFAAARNESLRHATGKWIMWLDADERLDETNRCRLTQLLANLDEANIGYLMRQSSQLEHGPNAVTHVDQVRLFPNHRELRWQYRVHEQILPSLRSLGAQVRPTDIVITHVGFEDPTLQGPKVERNLRLLLQEIQERPDDTFILYNLGAVAITQNRIVEALTYFERCIQFSQPGDHMLAKVHALVARAHQQAGNQPEALVACRRGRQAFPDDAELLFLEASLLHQRNDLAGAERSLLEILRLPRHVSFSGADSGLVTYRPRLFLTDIYRAQNRLADAEAMLQAVVAECPSMTSAWRQLAEVCFEQARWPEMNAALEHLRNDPQESLHGSFILAQAHLSKKEFAQARTILETVIARVPKAVEPKVMLSRVFLQEGVDWTSAERLLREILVLDPNHREAQHNLQVLLHQTQPTAKPPQTVQRTEKESHLIQEAMQNHVPTKKGVSLCMIVKNEENNLSACLESVKDLVDEMIIVDTGSTDRTKEIAFSFGAKVHEFPWIDDFASARNESLKYARRDWVFWMDADDRLDEANRAKLRILLASLQDENAGYVMKCLCLPDPETKTATEVDHLRLFRNRPDIRWSYRVHEQILPAIRRSKGDVRWSDVVVHHTGYQDSAMRKRKLARDERILLLSQAENPDDAFILFNLASICQEQDRHHDAIQLLRRSLELSDVTDSIVRKLYAMLAQSYNQLGETDKALTTLREGRAAYPDDIELLFQEGATLRNIGDPYGAIRAWEEVLTTPAGAHFASINTGIRSYLTRHNLAQAYQDIKRFDQAEMHWRKIITEHPDYDPGWRGLTDTLLLSRRWDALESLAQDLTDTPNGPCKAALTRGRAMLARGEFDPARACFDRLKEEYPQALEPRVFLSYAYLQEGKDLIAAERALRDILALDPNQVEARRNLDVLLDQQHRSGAR